MLRSAVHSLHFGSLSLTELLHESRKPVCTAWLHWFNICDLVVAALLVPQALAWLAGVSGLT